MLNLFAVSAEARETAINTFQTLDQSIVVGEGDFVQLVPMRETNRGEATGYEEPTEMYDNGRTYNMSFSPKFCTYNKLAFILAYCLGSVTSTTVFAGRRHVITPIDGYIDGDRSNPTFTAAQRLGGGTQKMRFASGAVQSMTESYSPGEWVKLSANMAFTGKYEATVYEVTVTDLDNVTSLTLPSNVVGTNAQERLDSVQSIRVEYNGIKDQYVAPVSVTNVAGPPATATVTIASLGGTGSTVNYKVLYRPPEPAWGTLPAAVSEPNLKVSQIFITIGGSWNGTAFQGGRTVCSDLGSLEVSFSNDGLEPVQTPCSSDPDQQYAGVMKRTGRTQTVTLSKELRDDLMNAMYNAEENIGLHIIADGPSLGVAGGSYRYERIWPRLAITDRQLSSENSRNQETLTLEALVDPVYGSTIAVIQNLVNTYAA